MVRNKVIGIGALAATLLVGFVFLWNGSPDPYVGEEVAVSSREESALEAPQAAGLEAVVDASRDEVEAPLLPEAEDVPEVEEEPVLVFWSEITLNVRDAATRAPLLGVEVRSIPDVYSSSGWSRPGSGPDCKVVLVDAVSPITLRAYRHEGDDMEEHLGRGVEIWHAGSSDRQLPEMQRAHLPRGQVFFARAPGHSWGRVLIDLREGGAHDIFCGADASLEVQFTNAQPAACEATGRPVFLYVFEGGKIAEQVPLTPARFLEGIRLDGLPPATYSVSVELGPWWDFSSRFKLGSATVDVEAGGVTEVGLSLIDPPPPPTLVPVAGTITFPPFAEEEELTLRLFNVETYTQGDADAEIELSAMKRAGPSSRTWSWDAGQIPVGRYQAKVWPLLWSEQVDVPAAGVRDVTLVSGPLARVVTTVIDARSRAVVPVEELFWSNARTMERMANHLGIEIGPFDDSGSFVFHTVPGPIDLSVTPGGELFGYSSADYEVHAGENAIALELRPLSAIRVEFRDQGATLPVGELNRAVVYECVEGDSRITYDQTATVGSVALSGPGRFKLSFDGIGPPKYRAVQPRIVQVGEYEMIEVVVDLERP